MRSCEHSLRGRVRARLPFSQRGRMPRVPEFPVALQLAQKDYCALSHRGVLVLSVEPEHPPACFFRLNRPLGPPRPPGPHHFRARLVGLLVIWGWP
jgi:hypothetical protein